MQNKLSAETRQRSETASPWPSKCVHPAFAACARNGFGARGRGPEPSPTGCLPRQRASTPVVRRKQHRSHAAGVPTQGRYGDRKPLVGVGVRLSRARSVRQQPATGAHDHRDPVAGPVCVRGEKRSGTDDLRGYRLQAPCAQSLVARDVGPQPSLHTGRYRGDRWILAQGPRVLGWRVAQGWCHPARSGQGCGGSAWRDERDL